MSGMVVKVLAVAFCFAAVEALQCYNCALGLWNLCLTTTITCEAGEHCYSGEGTAVGFMNIKMKGCLHETACNKTTNVDFNVSGNDTIFSMTKTCCNFELCNSAPAGLPGALQLALASIVAVFAANTLV